MRYTKDQKEETRQQILEAVHRGFRQRGFDGAGVDGLAKGAGVTSGAFYAHFDSKADAFRQAVALGVGQFTQAVESFQEENNDQWLEKFVSFYLGEKRRCELGDSCALQSLTPEVGRSDEQTRLVFESELLKAAEAFTTGLPQVDDKPDIEHAWVNLAMLIGGVTLARAVQNPELADEITEAVSNEITHKNTHEKANGK